MNTSSSPLTTVAPNPKPKTSRVLKTRRSVFIIDRIASLVIKVGGVLVIAAVLGILVYLVSVVLPLFQGPEISTPLHYALFDSPNKPHLLFAELDEYKDFGIALDATGKLITFNARNGRIVKEKNLFPSAPSITAFSRSPQDGQVAFGFADGTIRLGTIKIAGEAAVEELGETLTIGTPDSPVLLLDYKASKQGKSFTVLKKDGGLFFTKLSQRENLLTGKIMTRVKEYKLPYTQTSSNPSYLLQNSLGNQVYIAWRDGSMTRYDLRNLKHPIVAENNNLLMGESADLTDLQFTFGDQSILASDSRGQVNAWFLLQRQQTATIDGYELVCAHELLPHDNAVNAVGTSLRDKGLATGTSNGEIFLRHLTSEQVLAKLQLPNAASVETLQITPKADGIFAVDSNGHAWIWNVDNPHPETTWTTIFGKVWYEGYPEPAYTWQSSSGNDDFEPKLSLIPLIFGTLKATLYSMVFAIPLALLAAIFTREFLDPKLRTPLKASIETMASLPSVVLGFVAALVLAPLVENWLVAILTAFALIPLVVLLFGYIWQMLPEQIIVRVRSWQRLLILLGLILFVILLSRPLGNQMSQLLFAGDLKAWLDGQVGSAGPGLSLLLWPGVFFAIWFTQGRLFTSQISFKVAHWKRLKLGILEMGKLVIILIVTTVVSMFLGEMLAGLGIDPRGSIVNTYVQRNTLIIGFAMGFAVIPIIYTVTEDALSSVPQHLRSASLGCGATRWQTAVRVVVPVAMSGIFSAVMIGLGRAVGETMIVVMAAGNTPIMDINIFNGLRALSANIAVELPEAVKDSTLFRMLFLAALTLFAITFVINTVAELIRIRFRKRAYQL